MHKQAEGQREREKQAPHQARPWNHDLSQRQMLNQRNHPGAPHRTVFKTWKERHLEDEGNKKSHLPCLSVSHNPRCKDLRELPIDSVEEVALLFMVEWGPEVVCN